MRRANDRHTQDCDFWCNERHWTLRSIRLKLTWKIQALLRFVCWGRGYRAILLRMALVFGFVWFWVNLLDWLLEVN